MAHQQHPPSYSSTSRLSLSPRSLTITLALLSLTTSLLTTLLVHFLSAPLILSLPFLTYNLFSLVVSATGLVGAWRSHAVSVSIFAAHFLLDTFMCAIPRFMGLVVLGGAGKTFICNPAFLPAGYRDVGECERVVGVAQALALVAALGIAFAQITVGWRVWVFSQTLERNGDEARRCGGREMERTGAVQLEETGEDERAPFLDEDIDVERGALKL